MTISTTTDRMRADFAEYLAWGGRHDFATWAARYADDYEATR